MNYTKAIEYTNILKEWIQDENNCLDKTDENFYSLELYINKVLYALENIKLFSDDEITQKLEKTFIDSMNCFLEDIPEKEFEAKVLDKYFDKIGFTRSLELLRDNGLFCISESDKNIYKVYWLEKGI